MMKLILRFIYYLTRIQPLWFLLAAGKAMGWEVSVEHEGDFVISIKFTNPNIEPEEG